MRRLRFRPPARRRAKLPLGFLDIRWHSRALTKRGAAALHLPPHYEQQRDKRYPVLYLLHGSGHDRLSLLRDVGPHDHIPLLGEAIFVIPDGDQGWWLDSPMQPNSQYGAYVLELIGFVDDHYRTVAQRSARGICGFSVGGFGAMLLASQHPELFGAASSLLGPLDIVQLFPDHDRLRLLLGPDRDTWQRFNPTCCAEGLVYTALRFSTGMEASDRPQNEAFASALRSLNISFEYHLDAGKHDTHFVAQHLGAHFAFHRRAFDPSMSA